MDSTGDDTFETRRAVREHRAAKLLALREKAEQYLANADLLMGHRTPTPAHSARARAYAAMASATVDLAMLYKWSPTMMEELNAQRQG